MDLKNKIHEFLKEKSKDGNYELLNEASLQNDLAHYIKDMNLFDKVQLERNIKLDYPDKKNFIKKEMDLFLVSNNDSRYCIEIKFPPGRSTERRIFHTYKDIYFCSQLIKKAHFKKCYSLFIVAHETYKNKFGKNISLDSIKKNKYYQKLKWNWDFKKHEIKWGELDFIVPNQKKDSKSETKTNSHYYFLIEISIDSSATKDHIILK